MLGYYVNDISERLASRQETDGWQVVITFFKFHDRRSLMLLAGH
jgi:hypothetical protein